MEVSPIQVDILLTEENILEMNRPTIIPTERASHVGMRWRGCLLLGCIACRRILSCR